MSVSRYYKERGTPLTGWLVFMLCANTFAVFANWRGYEEFSWLVDRGHEEFYGHQFASLLLVGLALINLAALVQLWNWKFKGFNWIVYTSIGALVINILLGISLPLALLGLGGVVILWTLVKPKRHMFE